VLERHISEAYPRAVATLGGNVKAVRLRAGYKSQGDAAEALGYSQARFSDIENDRYDTPDLQTLLHIATTFNCSLDDLIVGRSPKYDSQRMAAAISVPKALAVADTDLLTQVLELWPQRSRHGHEAILVVLEKWPTAAQQEEARQPETLEDFESVPTERNNSEKKRGA
jgi:transcriptional regulator with XRE-family HTH domain